jgi:plastocyanin
MRTRLALLCSVLLVALVAVGCGSSSKSSSSTSSSSSSSKKSASSGGAAAPKSSATVQLKNIAFNPTTVTIKKGGTVKWTNDDSVGHDVTKESGPGPKFKSGASGGMKQGDTFQQKFTTPGTIHYLCTVHANMRATVVVK